MFFFLNSFIVHFFKLATVGTKAAFIPYLNQKASMGVLPRLFLCYCLSFWGVNVLLAL